jgi:hypothetical protein
MKFRLMVIVACVAFVCTISPLFAQNVEPTQTCEGKWLVSTTKVPGSTVTLRLSTTQKGLEELQWPNPNKEAVILETHRLKAPASSKGEVEVCTHGVVVVKSTESISLRDLQAVHKLPSGYYVTRVRFQKGLGVVGDTSDYVPIQIK